MKADAVTYAEAAEHWRVSRQTVARWVKRGLVDVTRTPSGRPRVILRSKSDMAVARALKPARKRR